MGQAKKESRKPRARKRAVIPAIVKWIAACAIVGVVVYAVSQMSNIAYGDAEIKVVDFSGLDAKQKRSALEAANAARCTCGCGMTLAQCVATDMTCPVREGNLDRIRTMVRNAM